MSEGVCAHTIVEQDVAVTADSLCPLCLVATVAALRTRAEAAERERDDVRDTLREIRAQQKEDFDRADAAQADAARLREALERRYAYHETVYHSASRNIKITGAYQFTPHPPVPATPVQREDSEALALLKRLVAAIGHKPSCCVNAEPACNCGGVDLLKLALAEVSRRYPGGLR